MFLPEMPTFVRPKPRAAKDPETDSDDAGL